MSGNLRPFYLSAVWRACHGVLISLGQCLPTICLLFRLFLLPCLPCRATGRCARSPCEAPAMSNAGVTSLSGTTNGQLLFNRASTAIVAVDASSQGQRAPYAEDCYSTSQRLPSPIQQPLGPLNSHTAATTSSLHTTQFVPHPLISLGRRGDLGFRCYESCFWRGDVRDLVESSNQRKSALNALFPRSENFREVLKYVADVFHTLLKLHHASILPVRCQWLLFVLGFGTDLGGGTSLY